MICPAGGSPKLAAEFHLRNSVSLEEKESLCSISSARDKKPIFDTIKKIIAEPGNRGFEGINPLSVVPIIVLAFFTHQRCVHSRCHKLEWGK